MKRHIKLRQYICIILAFIIVFSFIFQGTYASTTQPLLKKYMHSPEVTFLQSDLKRLGYFNHDTTDYFGGKINSDTYSKIDILLNGLVLKKGMSGKAVTAIQSDLKKLNYFNQEPTGYFGDITETALKNVQKQNSLVVTGVAGILTHSKIDILLKKPTAIKIVIDPGHGGIGQRNIKR
ncbi:MAG TPA: peptidoglycan-binding domain-containing protein [Clostridia bacterium]|nr:peptidoglycan-binding domain-containing protein [Clostridia bacterium]